MPSRSSDAKGPDGPTDGDLRACCRSGIRTTVGDGERSTGSRSPWTEVVEMQGAAQASQAFTEHQHRELKRGIDHIHDVACGIEGWVTPDLAIRVRDLLRWLDRELEPHVAWEDSFLYPEIDARTGSPWATRAARFDHRQIRAGGRARAGRRGAPPRGGVGRSCCPTCAATCWASRRSCERTSSARSASSSRCSTTRPGSRPRRRASPMNVAARRGP